MRSRPTRLLLIDDDEETCLIVRHLLRYSGESCIDLECVYQYDEGLERLCQQEHDICLLDYRLNDRDGLELLREAQRRGCQLPIIMLTGLGSREIDIEAMRAGAADYLLKDDLDATTLERAIRYALERQRLLRALEDQAGQLRLLAVELARAEECERRRIAQYLHDHLQQILAAAKIQAVALVGKAPPAAQEIGDLLTGMLDEAIESARSFSHELCPPVLYDRGLAAALHWLARLLRKKQVLDVAVTADSQSDPADPDMQVFLFQAVRELLLNAMKHGHADRAWITMHRDDGTLSISVEDNGVGCEPGTLFSQSEPKGLGLFSIQQRLNILHGSMSARAAPGEGCHITLECADHSTPHDRRDSPSTPSSNAASSSEAPIREAPECMPPGNGAPLRVMLVDDHRIVRDGLAGILEAEAEMEVVGRAVDGREAVEMAEKRRPDVILMDISMPRMDGIEATRAIHIAHPEIRVIGLSMHASADVARAMREAGAVAYLSKQAASSELVNVILEHTGGGQPTRG